MISVDTPQQLSLSVSLNDDATFENFYAPPTSHNRQVVAGLRDQLGDGVDSTFLFLWGGAGSGCSHLLQASCHRAQSQGLTIQYLPLQELANSKPADLLTGLEALDFIALDDLQAVAGDPAWELALFSLYNLLRDNGKRLVIAANANPRDLPIKLEDLRSRLQWGVTFQLHPLTDEEKQHALQMRARARGLELSDEVAYFLLQRLPRNMHQLFQQLQRLDQASLAEQRKLTIPFIKKVLAL